MTGKQKLKVYRTPIGFHDALHRRDQPEGSAESPGAPTPTCLPAASPMRVTDEALVREPPD
jgi:hypothetical protein